MREERFKGGGGGGRILEKNGKEGEMRGRGGRRKAWGDIRELEVGEKGKGRKRGREGKRRG